MTRKYRSRGTGVTGDPLEARANRRLQLITVSGTKVGKTLIEKMEDELDQTMRHREDLMRQHDLMPEEADDDQVGEIIDDLLKNEGRIQGMLKMLGIMRSTGMKTELTRARARIKHG